MPEGAERKPQQVRRADRVRIGRPTPGFTVIELLAVMLIIGALAGIGFTRLQTALDQAKVARAIGDIKALQTDIDSRDSLPADLTVVGRAGLLDPWGNPYVYFLFPPSNGKGPPAGARRDKFLVPVNSEYDLYSFGPDGQTSVPFTAKKGRDDIVRASDGGYIGPASKY